MPSAAAASAWISLSVIASSFFTRGTHSALRSSMTSRHRKRTRESIASDSLSALRRAKYMSIICFGSFGDASSSFPAATRRLHSASTFSSGGVWLGGPRRSATHAFMIFSAIMCFLYSSPMSLMLPMVRTLTRFVAALRSAASAMFASSSLAFPAPSNSSWHVLRRTRLNVVGFPPGSADGNSGSSFDRRRHTSAYMLQNPGSQIALSKTMDIVSARMSASSMPASRSCSIRRSNFSGVILFRIPLISRVTLARSSSAPPLDHALAAFTMVAPSVPSGSGVRSTLPPCFLLCFPALRSAASDAGVGLACQSFASDDDLDDALLDDNGSPPSVSFFPHCPPGVASSSSSSLRSLTSLMTTSSGDVASSTGISVYRCVSFYFRRRRREGAGARAVSGDVVAARLGAGCERRSIGAGGGGIERSRDRAIARSIDRARRPIDRSNDPTRKRRRSRPVTRRA